jgi:hypothetical protein
MFAGLGYGIYASLNVLFAPVFVTTPIGGLLLGAFAGIGIVGAGAWVERVVSPLLWRHAAEG